MIKIIQYHESNINLKQSAGHLDSHDLARGFVDHLVDGAIRPATDLPEVSQIFCREVTMLLRRDLQFPRGLDTVCPQTLSGGWDDTGEDEEQKGEKEP